MLTGLYLTCVVQLLQEAWHSLMAEIIQGLLLELEMSEQTSRPLLDGR